VSEWHIRDELFVWHVVFCLWGYQLAMAIYYAVALTGLYALYVALAGLVTGTYQVCEELVEWIKTLL